VTHWCQCDSYVVQGASNFRPSVLFCGRSSWKQDSLEFTRAHCITDLICSVYKVHAVGPCKAGYLRPYVIKFTERIFNKIWCWECGLRLKLWREFKFGSCQLNAILYCYHHLLLHCLVCWLFLLQAHFDLVLQAFIQALGASCLHVQNSLSVHLNVVTVAANNETVS
jgi:hypothetical protein